jgi:hypothetical protein
MFGSDLHLGTPPNDVVHLVLAVRFLRIGPAFRQNINARAHGRDAKEFEVEFLFPRTPAGEIVDLEEVGHKEQFSVLRNTCRAEAKPLYPMQLRTEN